MFPKLPVVLISLILFLLSCNKEPKETIAIIYILEDKTCVYKEPTRQSECLAFLNKSETVNVTNKSVEDKQLGRQLTWRKVIREGQFGYLPVEGEVGLFQFSTIVPVHRPYVMVVKASRLRLRSLPSVNSEVLELLPTGVKVSILGLSATRYQIDGISEVWAHIQAPSERIGFAFLGYLEPEPTPVSTSDEEIEEEEGEEAKGFVEFRSPEPNVYLSPGETKGYYEESYCSKDVSERKGETFNKALGKFYNVIRKVKLEETVYYKLKKEYSSGSDNESMNFCLTAWISEKDVEYHDEEFRPWYMEKNKEKFPEKFFKYANPEKLDYERTELKRLHFSESETKQIYHATLYYLSSELAPSDSEEFILEETDNSFVNLLGSNYERFIFEDLNADGINEIIADNDFRGSHTYEYFQILNNKAVKILTIDYNDYESEENQCNAKLSLHAGEKSIKVKVNHENDFSKICNHYTKNGKLGIYGHKKLYRLENGKLIPDK